MTRSMSETKRERRRKNFGPQTPGRGGRNHNTVRRTSQRSFLGVLEHRPPKDLKNDDGLPWTGFSKRNSRKPFPVEPSWKAWLRQDGLRRWREAA